MADGTVRFAFKGDIALLDRIGMWGAGVEDLEPDGTDEDGDPVEDDGRGDDPVRETPPVVSVSPITELPPGVPQEMAGLVLNLMVPEAA